MAEPPHIPRSRDSRILKKFGSGLTSFVKQYPHQTNSKRDLKMEARSNDDDRLRASASTVRPKPTTNDTALRLATTRAAENSSSSEAVNEPLVQDFQDHYRPRPNRSHAGSVSPQLGNAVSSSESDRPLHSPDFSDFDDDATPASRDYDYSRHSMHVPARTSSHPHAQAASRAQSRRPPTSRKQSISAPSISTPTTPEAAPSHGYGRGDRSSADSIFSQETSATSILTLPALQTKGPDNSDAHLLEPLTEDEPRSFDLLDAPQDSSLVGMYALERRAEQLFSSAHLQIIFDDPKLLLRFTGYLNAHRPKSIPVLIYYLDALKALRAIRYANAIAEALDPLKDFTFTDDVVRPTGNAKLEEKARQAFEILVRDDLPAYIAHTWVQVVSVSIQRRITGTLAPHLREASEGLAEVFCLTDPSRVDNPIVFASEEFTRTTQYGMSYVIGRNCRFLQGPKTNANSVRRLAQACAAGKELTEVFVNYRRDGSPFMNLLMTAPLMDSRGNIRYFIGAQVDCSGLVKDCSDLDGLLRLVESDEDPGAADHEERANRKDEFQELSQMFNGAELETVRKYGGRMHREYLDDSDSESLGHGRPRLLLQDPTQDAMDRHRDSMASSLGSTITREKLNGKLEGVYQHYLLVRPAPSLRILFTSPSLRVPGILQSPFLHRIGGSPRVRTDLSAALSEGRGVTAKIRWLTKADESGDGEGRPRWIHCTPLLGHSGAVGVWMIILVDEEGSQRGGEFGGGTGRRFRPAPPVAAMIGGKEWEGSGGGRSREREREREREGRERRLGSAYEKESERRPSGHATPVATRREEGYERPAAASRTHSGRSQRTTTAGAAASSAGRGEDRAGSAVGQRQPYQPIDAGEFSFGIRTPGPGDARSEDPRRGMY
ncbi:hypothetical protein LTR91_011791 [Friedmanniomyces endolithicus]|uniref:PAS domain-containing protein n=1 Tax=Friedmanniomyces endolithicus TaxID=329885 RepID=A0AAN6KGX1_9PEZI|nr:hypothetical protein LTR94_010654 [Friedmanniomyces endolithicus]KAK0772902.1 hypothetical protein LTR38_016748 [Friedmanniomyces endolithicus]KAK0775510.1 hypothetical protein LTR75_016561 [Friedmanniomyces endolithicus]KAK0788977.1 hypothetical protein LTR59_009788 [Friedmanniomyces endolithicus]KAK0827996.1 hypothetical protein LTR03_016691 [Friedmanniomyces endolithicus]